MQIKDLTNPRDRAFCQQQETGRTVGYFSMDDDPIFANLSDARTAAWLAGSDVSDDKWWNDGLKLGGSRSNEL